MALTILNKINIRLVFCIFFLSLLTFKCGIYSFSGSTISTHIKTVAVPLFEDNTPEFDVDQQITDAIIDAINQDNTLKIANVRNCDSIINGTILRITDSAGQYDSNENASSFRVTITIHISFEDVKKNKTIWEDTLSNWGSYSENREDGIHEALEKLSTDIINRTVSGW